MTSRRCRALDGQDGRPLGDHALLADGRRAARATFDGSADWWCPDAFERGDLDDDR